MKGSQSPGERPACCPRHMDMRRTLLVLALVSLTACTGQFNDLVPLGTDAVEVCGPPCATVEEPARLAALVRALSSGDEGSMDCDLPDQSIYTVRFRAGGTWRDPVVVPASCGSTQGLAKRYQVTDEARGLLQEVADAAYRDRMRAD